MRANTSKDRVVRHRKPQRVPTKLPYSRFQNQFGVESPLLSKDYALAKDGQERCTRAVFALLKQAHQRIEQTEERIAYLNTLSSVDELTGLANRRGFYQAFLRELDRTNRDLSQAGLLVFIDIDNYQTIKARYGVHAGIAALRLVAKILGKNIRVMDIAAKLDGDEFILLLSNTDRNKALERAQRLAWDLGHLSLQWNDQDIPITASLGLKEYKKGDRAETIFMGEDRTIML